MTTDTNTADTNTITWGTIIHLILMAEVGIIVPFCLLTLSLAR